MKLIFLPGVFALGLMAVTSGMAKDKAMNGVDNTFATKAAQGGEAEVQLGRLAVKNSSNPDVKAFGQRMIDDHSMAGKELKEIASRDGITLPGAMDSKDQATYNRLSKLTGAEFDRAYMKDMVADHKEDIAEFRKEANSGANDDLKSFAAKTLPTLEEHLRSAQQTDAKVK
jgi:putative membrane protein